MNKQSWRISKVKEPEEAYKVMQSIERNTVWSLISEKCYWTDFFEEESDTGQGYERMLCYTFFPNIRDCNHDMVYVKGSNRTHLALIVYHHSAYKSESRWTDRSDPVEMPSCWTGLTLSDFLVWDTSNILYSKTVLLLLPIFW